MKELVASFLFSALRNFFRNQPDLSDFTPQTNEREPNLSFHLANELWPYLFWLQCDFDITKADLGDRRPDIVFHRRGIHSLNFLVIEVKRRQNPKGTNEDLKKIQDDWFGERLLYRFGASVLMDEDKEEFSVQLLENVGGDTPLNLTQESPGYCQRVRRATPKRRAELGGLVARIAETEETRKETGELNRKLDQRVRRLYAAF